MKTMTCNQLGGACETEFRAESFDEMARLSQQHGMEMFQNGDEAHLRAMAAMQGMSPDVMRAWFEEKKQTFDALPDE